MSGRQWWHPSTKQPVDRFYAGDSRRMSDYPKPSYVVVEVNGQIDVIDHRRYSEQNREPTRAFFWMCNDPESSRKAWHVWLL